MQMHSNIEQVLFVNFDQFLYYFPENILWFLPSASSFRNVFVVLCNQNLIELLFCLREVLSNTVEY